MQHSLSSVGVNSINMDHSKKHFSEFLQSIFSFHRVKVIRPNYSYLIPVFS